MKTDKREQDIQAVITAAIEVVALANELQRQHFNDKKHRGQLISLKKGGKK